MTAFSLETNSFMPLYHMLLDARLFHEEISPALAASWRQRSFAPCLTVREKLLSAAETFSSRYHLGGDEPLLVKIRKDLPFDRNLWKLLAGEMFLFAASEIPELQIAPETLLCLLAPAYYRTTSVSREQFAPIQQALYGARELNFGGKFYRPEHAGYNDIADVCRLADYLAEQRPDQWTPADLQELKDVEAADRAEELDFVREWYPALCDLYERARQREQIVIIEAL